MNRKVATNTLKSDFEQTSINRSFRWALGSAIVSFAL